MRIYIGCLLYFMMVFASGCTTTNGDILSRTKPQITSPEKKAAHQDESGVKPPPPLKKEAVTNEPASSKKEPAQTKSELEPLPAPKPEFKKESAFERSLKTIKFGVLDFHEEKLSNVLKMISAMTGVNFMIKNQLIKEIDGGKAKGKADDKRENKILDIKITIFLKNVSMKTALKALCDQYGLFYRIENDIIRIKDERDDFLLKWAETTTADDYPKSRGMFKEIDLKGQPLLKVLKQFSKKSGINIICRPNISNEPIYLLIKDVPVKTAIEIICKKYNFWYKTNEKQNYICLMSAEDFGNEMDLEYKVKTRVFNLKYASSPQVADSISCAMGDRVEFALPANLESYEHLKLPDVEDEEGRIERAGEDKNIIKGIEIPNFEESVEKLGSDKIADLMQTRLGLMLTSDSLRWLNKEVGFAIITIFLRNNSIIACSTDNGILDEIAKIIAKLDTPTPQVLVECKVLDVVLSNDFSSFFQITDFSYQQKGGTSFGDKLITYDVPYFGAGGGSALYNFVNDSLQLSAKIELLQEEGIINLLSTPMIIVAQNSEAVMKAGMENFPFFKEMEVVRPVITNDGEAAIPGYAVPTYDRVPLVGTTLRFTPQINEDESVTLKLYMERSDVKKGVAEIKYPVFSADGTVAELITTSVDVKESEIMNTIVAVPKEHTLVIGGIVKEEDSVEESKVPFLGDLPLIGFFFKDHTTKKSRTEMIVLLTPHIIMTPDKVNEVSEKALKDIQHPVIKEGKNSLLELNAERQNLKRTGKGDAE